MHVYFFMLLNSLASFCEFPTMTACLTLQCVCGLPRSYLYHPVMDCGAVLRGQRLSVRQASEGHC